ncbi:MAG: hypothetical protein JWP75_1826 [Frondihabitans sp.]|nr:hypothetical protein [Frondihabitans sp.]
MTDTRYETASTTKGRTAGYLLNALRLAPHRRAHWAAIRAATSMAVPIIVVWSLGHLDWTLYVAFGGFAAVYGRHASYPDRLRMQAGSGATIAVTITLGTAIGVIAPGSLVAVLAMAVSSGAGFLLSRKEGWLPLGSLFFVFASGATSSFAHRASDIPIAFGLAALSSLFAITLGQSGRFTRAGRRALKSAPPSRPTWSQLVAARGVRWDLVRYAAGPLVAGGIATMVGIGHPYWAAVSATVPLAGVTIDAQLTRAAHRLIGTLLGLAVALVILLGNPSDVVMIAVVVVFQAFAELFVLRNYGLAVVGLTPLALVLSHLASPVPIGQLVSDRAVETAIGVAVAIALMFLGRPKSTSLTP